MPLICIKITPCTCHTIFPLLKHASVSKMPTLWSILRSEWRQPTRHTKRWIYRSSRRRTPVSGCRSSSRCWKKTGWNHQRTPWISNSRTITPRSRCMMEWAAGLRVWFIWEILQKNMMKCFGNWIYQRFQSYNGISKKLRWRWLVEQLASFKEVHHHGDGAKGQDSVSTDKDSWKPLVPKVTDVMLRSRDWIDLCSSKRF